jgi:SlyX protein
MAAMSDDPAARLDRIEANLAHLEHQVEQLNEVIIAQGKDLEQLRKLLQRQAATLETIELEHIKTTNVKPPHY